jgi:hypothetical protein
MDANVKSEESSLEGLRRRLAVVIITAYDTKTKAKTLTIVCSALRGTHSGVIYDFQGLSSLVSVLWLFFSIGNRILHSISIFQDLLFIKLDAVPIFE